MKVNWKIAAAESPILFFRQAEHSGLRVNHYRLAPGDLVEQSSAAHEITVTLDGCLTTRKQTAGGAKISRGRAGNLCLTPAGERVAAFWNEEIECLLIDIKPSLLVQTALENDFSPRVELNEIYETNDSLIQNIAFALLNEGASTEAFGRLYADSLVQTLIFHLLKNYGADSAARASNTSKVGLSGYRLRRVKEHIREHLAEEITLAELAAVAGLSQFYFARAFRCSTGLTPQRFLMQSRLDCAKRLLADSDLPLVEVGMRAGFKSQSHFTTHFRKLTSHTPKTFRESKFGRH